MIRSAAVSDKAFWLSLDRHIREEELERKIGRGECFIMPDRGILRYSFFWDEIPFMNMLFVKENERGRGYGRALVSYWENLMESAGYSRVMVSTRSDENAQHFFRALGYHDCGGLMIDPGPLELIMMKRFGKEAGPSSDGPCAYS